MKIAATSPGNLDSIGDITLGNRVYGVDVPKGFYSLQRAPLYVVRIFRTQQGEVYLGFNPDAIDRPFSDSTIGFSAYNFCLSSLGHLGRRCVFCGQEIPLWVE